MGIIVSKNNDENSRLNQRITADLRERANKTALGEDPDLVEDSDYAKDLKKTGKYTWIWIVLIVLAIISLVVIALI
ncbi:hypothetical protein J6D24_02230 [Candidatus Saccharibacteria bacterium]|nr:hypothetical protein [Candidatus Saccharibacteria bacterium]MBR0416000.1 hypothetical protein [Candidatus Saccharibacteria bacterium]